MVDEGSAGDGGRTMPEGPPTAWPEGPPAGAAPVAPVAAPGRRRRWPWVLGAGVAIGVVAGGAGAALVLAGDDGDEAYCAALDTRARVDVPMIVFLETDATANGAARLGRQLEERADVGAVDHVDRDEAFAEAQEMFADAPEGTPSLRPEDVPTSLRFTASDSEAARPVREALEDELLVLDIHTSSYRDRSVRFLAQLVIDEDIEGPLGRFGHWVGPVAADELRATAPDAVADDVDLLLDALAAADGVIEARHVAAIEDVVLDAGQRCP